MCSVCELVDEGDVDEGSTTCEFVWGVDVAEGSEDDLVTTEYRSLRDRDGLQCRDPWGGSSESRLNCATVSSTLMIVLTLSFTSSSLYTSALPCHIYDFCICWAKGGAPSF